MFRMSNSEGLLVFCNMSSLVSTAGVEDLIIEQMKHTLLDMSTIRYVLSL